MIDFKEQLAQGLQEMGLSLPKTQNPATYVVRIRGITKKME